MFEDFLIEEPFYFYDERFDQSINSFSEASDLVEKKEKISTNFISNTFPEFYSLSKINQILSKNIKDKNFKNIIVLKEEEIKEYYLIQNLMKQSLNYDSFDYNFSNEQNKVNENSEEHKKRELKLQQTDESDEKRDVHTKFRSDNIIKKIKVIFFNYAISFLNNLLNLDGKERLFKLDYYLYINNLKRNTDLGFLYMSLRELFSLKVSKKYLSKKRKEEGNKEEDHNKIILDNAYEKADETLKFALDMTFINFIDLFIYKTTVQDLINQKSFINSVDANIIQKCISGLEKSLKNVMKKNNNDMIYFSNFIFFLYNYERWFFRKKGRNIKKNLEAK